MMDATAKKPPEEGPERSDRPLPPPLRLVTRHHDASEDLSQAERAGFWPRAAATLIDIVMMTLVVGALDILCRRLLPPGSGRAESVLVNLVASLAYVWAPLYRWGQTLGKKIMGLRLINEDSSPQLSAWRVFLRENVRVLSFLPLGAGFWMVAVRADRRSLHDLIAKTRVIRYR